MTASVHHHRVEAEGTSGVHRGVLYDGPDAAEAMAAWSKAVGEGDPYVTLESMRCAAPAEHLDQPETENHHG